MRGPADRTRRRSPTNRRGAARSGFHGLDSAWRPPSSGWPAGLSSSGGRAASAAHRLLFFLLWNLLPLERRLERGLLLELALGCHRGRGGA